jgi:hypothetical protein
MGTPMPVCCVFYHIGTHSCNNDLDHIIATMSMDSIAAFDIIVALVIPLTVLLKIFLE